MQTPLLIAQREKTFFRDHYNTAHVAYSALFLDPTYLRRSYMGGKDAT
jgi:hypothetical protein